MRKIQSHQVRETLPIALTAALVLFALIALFMPKLPLTELPLQREREAIANTIAEIESTRTANQEAVTKLAPFWEMCGSAMQESEANGMVLFRERIEKAAGSAGLQSRNMGNVRQVDLTNSVALFEVSFSADGKTAELVAFLKSLYAEKPRLYWRTIAIKPNTTANTLNLTGTLCVLSIANPPAMGKEAGK